MSAINSNESLSGNQTLTSKNGTFILGFFKPGNSSNWYIGIWYGTISEQTIVWVANRVTPITNTTTSKLLIWDDRNLVLINQFKTVVWSTNVTNIKSSSTEAVIFDNGNFLLRDKYNSSIVLWESFDHPTDTSLPGSKFGLNRITGVNKRLISWKNENDPAPGLFSYEFDPQINEFVIYWNNSFQYWTSGKWNGMYFESVPEMEMYTQVNILSYNFVDNETGTYFIYFINSSWSTARIVMGISGLYTVFSWRKVTQVWANSMVEPKAQCDVYNLCGPFGISNGDFLNTCNCIKGFTVQYPTNWVLRDYTGGCTRKTTLNCNQNGSRKGNEDRFYEMSDMTLPYYSWRIDNSNLKDCKLACLNNCSCTAYSYSDDCYLWYGDLINLKDGEGNGGETLYLRLASSELPNPKSKIKILIGMVFVGSFLGVSFAFALFSIVKKKWGLRKLRRIDGSIIVFTYSDLLHITFAKGTRTFMLLVYEHMSLGSLDKHLFGEITTHLAWSTRYQIALGIGRGLHYLHEGCSDRIIHCDIKPGNILLDESFVPKIADFGLAKLLGHDFSRVLTSMRVTVGYLAPEWITGTTITTKADIYNYGMMLFEIVFEKRNWVQEEGVDDYFVPALAARKLVEGDIMCLLDVKLIDDTDIEELQRVLKIALWCVQVEEDLRPTMGKVIQMLEGVTDVSMPPIPSSFQVFTEVPSSVKFSSGASSKISSEI